MQIHCKKCGKDVTMETEFETRSPYRIINNHKCESKNDYKLNTNECG